MKFSVIICTYQRPESISRLMNSVLIQTLYPDEVLIVDGSEDDETRIFFGKNRFPNLIYHKVKPEDRGLTKQRNFGIRNTAHGIEIVCFLDDDVVLEADYFKELIGTYSLKSEAVGVGGYIINPGNWIKSDRKARNDEYEIDGWIRKLGSRYYIRKRLGLLSNKSPGYMPGFSNGFPIGFLPPSGRVYAVEFFMGGVSSYRKQIFENVKFSEYFQGYGLYEDMDFCLRASREGQLYVNTGARLNHLHDEASRPNNMKYGKMVIRNGWYVWRVKYPKPSFSDKFKWHSTAILLLLIRLGNILTTTDRKAALEESLGRITGYFSLFINKPA